MGILKFFKKNKKIEEIEIKPERISFNQIEEWSENKEKELENKEKEIFETINEKMPSFLIGLDSKVDELKKVDLELKKVDGRTKVIVKQGLDNYLKHVQAFKEKIHNSKRENLKVFIEEINKIFSNFDKSSYLFYQRATYLIGKEMANVREEINNLSTYFKETFNQNEKIIDSLGYLSRLKSKILEFNKMKEEIEKMINEEESFAKKIKEDETKIEESNEEIKTIKSSKEYLENLKLEEKIKFSKENLNKEISNLKGLIDFKKLINFFHSHKKDMKKIKEYKENFREIFKKDFGKNLIQYLDESKLNNESIINKISKIQKSKEEIAKDKKLIIEDKTKEYLEKIRVLTQEIENIKMDQVKQKKRKEQLLEKNNNLKDSIKENSISIGAIISKE